MIKHKILIAEDQRKLSDVLYEEFKKQSYDVVVASDGKVAEEMFAQHLFSIVLLDINLPYKNGIELCRQFRSIDNKVPVIMLTALGDLDDKMEAFNVGADDYIVKPFHMQELLARVQVFLKRRGSNAIAETVTLPNAASMTYTVNGQVGVSELQNLVNTISIVPPNGVNDLSLLDNTATDTDTIGIFRNGFE